MHIRGSQDPHLFLKKRFLNGSGIIIEEKDMVSKPNGHYNAVLRDAHRRARIAKLNDEFRADCFHNEYKMAVLTAGVNALPTLTQLKAIDRTMSYNDFTPENDPWDEHDFGIVYADGYKFFWKIDYYDNKLEYMSVNPANTKRTVRCLTLMLQEEW